MNIRRERRDVMLAHKMDEAKLSKLPATLIAQPKLDGIRCLVYPSGRMVTSTGLEITTLPTLQRALTSWFRVYCEQVTKYFSDVHVVSDTCLDGELLCGPHSFQETSSIVKRKTVHPNESKIVFTAFDLKNPYMQAIRLQQLRITFNVLEALHANLIQLQAFEITNDKEAILSMCNNFVKAGFEGIILRNPNGLYNEKRTNDLLKYKPREKGKFYILSVKEECDKFGTPKGSLGSFELVAENGEIFSCGSGLTQQQREVYWKLRDKMHGKLAEIKYQDLTTRGVPHFPIFSQLLEGVE